MLTQSVLETQKALFNYFPINLASRTMAYRLDHNIQDESSNSNGTMNCEHMVSMVEPVDARVTAICTGQNFTNVTIL